MTDGVAPGDGPNRLVLPCLCNFRGAYPLPMYAIYAFRQGQALLQYLVEPGMSFRVQSLWRLPHKGRWQLRRVRRDVQYHNKDATLNRRRFPARLAALFILFLGLEGLALAAAPAVNVPLPSPPQFQLSSYVLEDVHSGHVIAADNPNKQIYPASLTKLMTLYIVFSDLKSGRIHLDDKVQIDKTAWRTGGSRMFLPLGAQVSVQELIRGVIVDSGNDAATALAEYVGGSESTFVTYMNKYAKRLGMDGTHFVNPTGLPNPQHYTTAADLAKLTRALIQNFPQYYHFFKEKTLTFNKITQNNRNGLLWEDSTVDGLKTGHTEEAGYNLIASADRSGDRLLSVVIGTGSAHDRVADSEALLNYGFRFFATKKLFAAHAPITHVRVWKGAKNQVALGVNAPLYVTYPQGQSDKLQAQEQLPDRIMAPLRKGQALGQLVVKLGGKTLRQVPLHALDGVPEGGVWTRLVDSTELFFDNHL